MKLDFVRLGVAGDFVSPVLDGGSGLKLLAQNPLYWGTRFSRPRRREWIETWFTGLVQTVGAVSPVLDGGSGLKL